MGYEPRSASRSRKKGASKLYAVRGGLKAGIYDSWSDAIDAGFKHKQGYGNACCFPPDEREKAELWIQRVPLVEGVVGMGQSWLKERPLAVRLIVLSLVATIYGF